MNPNSIHFFAFPNKSSENIFGVLRDRIVNHEMVNFKGKSAKVMHQLTCNWQKNVQGKTEM